MKARRTGLGVFPAKKVGKKYIGDFWKNWKKPERKRKSLVQNSSWERKALWLSPTTLATVREFPNSENAERYVRNAKRIEREVMNEKPKNFVLQPVQFFSRKGNLLLERVYRGPDVFNFTNYGKSDSKPRYLEALKKRLEKKGIDLEEKEDWYRILDRVLTAYNELYAMEAKRFSVCSFDSAKNNILFLDFDPKTEKVLFAIVDHGKPRSIPG